MKNWLLLASALACLPAHAIILEGQETQNGGGAAEQNFSYALAIAEPLFKMCASVSQCASEPEQKAALLKILEALPAERKNSTLLRFESGGQRFLLDGQVRIAVTGSDVADPIFLNRQMIYRKVNGQIIPYTVGEALGVLTHELGHHQGFKDHDFLDNLGGQVRAFFELKQDRLTVDNFTGSHFQSDIALNVFHTRQSTEPFAHTSFFWLDVNGQVHDLNGELRAQLKCPKLLGGENSELDGFRFSHFSWNDMILKSTTTSVTVFYPMEAKVWVECKHPDGRVARQFGAKINFEFYPSKGGKLNYRSMSLTLRPLGQGPVSRERVN